MGNWASRLPCVRLRLITRAGMNLEVQLSEPVLAKPGTNVSVLPFHI